LLNCEEEEEEEEELCAGSIVASIVSPHHVMSPLEDLERFRWTLSKKTPIGPEASVAIPALEEDS
jgi:hypothetical protein